MKQLTRGIIYLAGLAILALGITLNTKTGLGVSPIIAVAYAVSVICGTDFGNTVLLWYCVFVLVEIVLHGIKTHGRERMQKVILDVLQIPLSIVFTRFMNLYVAVIPDFAADCKGTFPGTFAGRMLFLLIAVCLTGIGAAMSLDMRLIPNPGDGIVQTISDVSGKEVGLVKNMFDVTSVLLICVIGLIFAHRIIGIGIGTLVAVLGVGRVIALFQHLFFKKIQEISGREKDAAEGA